MDGRSDRSVAIGKLPGSPLVHNSHHWFTISDGPLRQQGAVHAASAVWGSRSVVERLTSLGDTPRDVTKSLPLGSGFGAHLESEHASLSDAGHPGPLGPSAGTGVCVYYCRRRYMPFAPTKRSHQPRPSGTYMSKGNSDRKVRKEPERLSLRWAFIIAISLLAGVTVNSDGHTAIAIATVAAVAWALDQILP